MAKEIDVADLSLWGKDRHIALLNVFTDILIEKKSLKEVRKEEVNFARIIRAIKKKHDITDEKKGFKKFIVNARSSTNDLYRIIMELMKVYHHSLAVEIAAIELLKEAKVKHEIPTDLAESEIADVEEALRMAREKIETVRQSAQKIGKDI